jgi:Rhodopirellula transposase DDE domain
LADDLRLPIHVSHFPPGTSKWNTIEHRLFCNITENWRGRALHTFETVVALIGHTRTAAGLRVKAKLDKRRYRRAASSRTRKCEPSHWHAHPFHGD